MSWQAWAASLAEQARSYRRPPGAFSMTTDNELSMLESYARFSYTGAGTVVDLGCWLGATSLALGRGLADSAHATRHQPVHAVDRFVWEDWMTPIAQAVGVPWRLSPGDDFLAHAAELLSPYQSLVRLHRADILTWEPPPGPIEFLFIDAMKSWPLANRIAQQCFPRLLPGRSLVVQQDFGHSHPVGATNHLLMWRLRDCLLPVLHVPGSDSVVFFATAAMEPGMLPDLDPDDVSAQEIEAAWAHSLRSVGPEIAPSVQLCKLAFLAERGFAGHALTEARTFAARGSRVPGWRMAYAQDALTARRAAGRPGSREGDELSAAAAILAQCTC